MERRWLLMFVVFLAVFAFGASLIMPAYASNALTVEFSADPTVGLAPLEVNFFDNSGSELDIEGWAWYFGDEDLSERTWGEITPGAGWSARSGHSSVVLANGNIILMGGIKDSNVRLNDVWKSTDGGITWEEVTPVDGAGWSARSGHSSVVLANGNIILMGGRNDVGLTNDVWKSSDAGATWTEIIPTEGSEWWSARFGHSSVALENGKIILLGGEEDGNLRLNDVWKSSDDGATWEEIGIEGSNYSARVNHSAVALPDGTIVLTGGQGFVRFRDVWRSVDNGASWEQIIIPAEDWDRRAGHTSVVLPDGSIVLMGGYSGSIFLDDAWVSSDKGDTWTEVTAADVWAGKQFHSSNVMPDGSIVLMGGTGDGGYTNDVWRLETAGSTEQDATHTYEEPGIYTVALRVYNADEYDTAVEEGLITAESEFAGGDGSEENPWLIETAEQLDNVRNYLGSSHYFELADDIDLENYLSVTGDGYNGGAGWEPIGFEFYGNFDGKDHTISNLYINRQEENQIGLFARTGENASIKNVSLQDADVKGRSNGGILVGRNSGTITRCDSTAGEIIGDNGVGGLVGVNLGIIADSYSTSVVNGRLNVGGLVGGNYSSSEIINSHAAGNVTSKGDNASRAGGLVGSNENAKISGSHATGVVEGLDLVGGLAGRSTGDDSEINDSWAIGNVSGRGLYVGGLVGLNSSGASISRCHAEGDVTLQAGEQDSYGGLVGNLSSGTITESYALGDVTGHRNVGGLVGASWNSVVSDSYARGHVSGSHDNVGGLVGSNLNGTITSCNSTDGVITGSNWYVGGLVGSNSGMIAESYSTSEVYGFRRVGGLVGQNDSVVTDSYSTGNVSPSGDSAFDVGGLVGFNNNAKIIDCHAEGDVDGTSYVGGLVGASRNPESEISGSYATGNVSGSEDHVGGLAGSKWAGIISRCRAEGDIILGNQFVGGLVGELREEGTITESFALGNVGGNQSGGLVGNINNSYVSDSYATGDVQGDFRVGGLIGFAFSGEITNCYAVGLVDSVQASCGGLIGELGTVTPPTVTSSYYDSDTSGQTDDDGRGEPKTTLEMQQGTPLSDIYTGWSTAIWDFFPDDEYPQFTPLESIAYLSSLELEPGELIPDFEPTQYTYTVNVEHDVESIDVIATLSYHKPVMTIYGVEATSRVAETVSLNDPGTETEIDIVVTAEDGETVKNYTITVDRAPDSEKHVDAVILEKEAGVSYVEAELMRWADAFFTGSSDPLYDYVGGGPIVGIRSGAKYIDLGSYSDKYFIHGGDVQLAIIEAENLDQDIVDKLEVFHP